MKTSSAGDAPHRCCACGAVTVRETERRRVCRRCGHRTSALALDLSIPSSLDDLALEGALAEQRRREHTEVLRLVQAKTMARRFLDVGCATGDFLDVCREHGLEAEGVEPDRRLAAIARSKGHQVEGALFEHFTCPTRRFDAVTFNDVLEHIPDPGAALEKACSLLVPGGVIAVTLPSSRGVFYATARLLEGLRSSASFPVAPRGGQRIHAQRRPVCPSSADDPPQPHGASTNDSFGSRRARGTGRLRIQAPTDRRRSRVLGRGGGR